MFLLVWKGMNSIPTLQEIKAKINKYLRMKNPLALAGSGMILPLVSISFVSVRDDCVRNWWVWDEGAAGGLLLVARNRVSAARGPCSQNPEEFPFSGVP
jgi:hypothetical protein